MTPSARSTPNILHAFALFHQKPDNPAHFFTLAKQPSLRRRRWCAAPSQQKLFEESAVHQDKGVITNRVLNITLLRSSERISDSTAPFTRPPNTPRFASFSPPLPPPPPQRRLSLSLSSRYADRKQVGRHGANTADKLLDRRGTNWSARLLCLLLGPVLRGFFQSVREAAR